MSERSDYRKDLRRRHKEDPSSVRKWGKYEHGTCSMYTAGHCRCDQCKAANWEYTKARRAKIRAARPPGSVRKWGSSPEHSVYGYTKGCRCEVCSAAKRIYSRDAYVKRKAKEKLRKAGLL